MIINFSIQNFGSVKDKQTLSFEADKSTLLEDYYVIQEGKFRLLKMALIYGANASGKTTILKALNFLGELVKKPVEKKTDILEFEPYLFNKKTPHQNTIFSINFIQNEVHYFYQVEFNKKYIVREELDFYNPNKANVFIRTTDKKKQLTEITFGSKIKAHKAFEKVLTANTLWNNTVLGGFLKTNIDINEVREVTDWFGTYLSALITPRSDLSSYVLSNLESSELKKEDLINILKKADLNISDIKIETENKQITEDLIKSLEENESFKFITELKKMNYVPSVNLSFEHSLDDMAYDLPFKLESQGTQRYFGLAGILSLLIIESTIIPIDELESSLHPDLYIHFLLTFLVNIKKSQLIATTHNREILNNKDLFRNDAIWFTDKSATGATELYSLADFDTSVIRDTSNVYNAYKIGKLGGIPNLGDYYIDLEK